MTKIGDGAIWGALVKAQKAKMKKSKILFLETIVFMSTIILLLLLAIFLYEYNYDAVIMGLINVK